MRPDRSQAMNDARRLDGQRKHALVLAATTAALQAGRQPTIAAIARAAGVGRKFIYDHGDLRAEIELKAAQATQHQANDMIAAARVTGASLRADLENSKARNRRLQAQVRALEQRLSHAEGARLIADDLLPEDIVAQRRLATGAANQPNRTRAVRGDRATASNRRRTRRRARHQPRADAKGQPALPANVNYAGRERQPAWAREATVTAMDGRRDVEHDHWDEEIGDPWAFEDPCVNRTAIPCTDNDTAELIDWAVKDLTILRGSGPGDAGAVVSVLVSLAGEAEGLLWDAVADARDHGYTWDEIADRLATSVTTARRRYAAYAKWRNGPAASELQTRPSQSSLDKNACIPPPDPLRYR